MTKDEKNKTLLDKMMARVLLLGKQGHGGKITIIIHMNQGGITDNEFCVSNKIK